MSHRMPGNRPDGGVMGVCQSGLGCLVIGEPVNQRSIRSAAHEKLFMIGMPLTAHHFTTVATECPQLLAHSNVVHLCAAF